VQGMRFTLFLVHEFGNFRKRFCDWHFGGENWLGAEQCGLTLNEVGVLRVLTRL
jgi:hypothetical protein